MKLTIFILLTVLAALVEAFGLPHLSLFGTALPLTLICLVLVLPKLSTPAGLLTAAGTGLILDLNSTGPVGLYSSYCVLFAVVAQFLFTLPNQKIKNDWLHRFWVKSLILAIVATAMPLWGLLASLSTVQWTSGLGWVLCVRAVWLVPSYLLYFRFNYSKEVAV